MSKISLTSAQYMKQLNFIYYGLLVAPFLYAPIAVYFKESGKFGLQYENRGSYGIWVPVLALIMVIISIVNYNRKTKQIAEEEHLIVKVVRYRNLFITTLACLELPLVCSLVVYCLTLSYFFLTYTAIVALVFIYRRPRVIDIANHLKLTASEEARLKTPEELIIE